MPALAAPYTEARSFRHPVTVFVPGNSSLGDLRDEARDRRYMAQGQFGRLARLFMRGRRRDGAGKAELGGFLESQPGVRDGPHGAGKADLAEIDRVMRQARADQRKDG